MRFKGGIMRLKKLWLKLQTTFSEKIIDFMEKNIVKTSRDQKYELVT